MSKFIEAMAKFNRLRALTRSVERAAVEYNTGNLANAAYQMQAAFGKFLAEMDQIFEETPVKALE